MIKHLFMYLISCKNLMSSKIKSVQNVNANSAKLAKLIFIPLTRSHFYSRLPHNWKQHEDNSPTMSMGACSAKLSYPDTHRAQHITTHHAEFEVREHSHRSQRVASPRTVRLKTNQRPRPSGKEFELRSLKSQAPSEQQRPDSVGAVPERDFLSLLLF